MKLLYSRIKKGFCEKRDFTYIKSLMFIPGNQEKMLKKSININAHVISPDLEDSVPLTEKEKARKMVNNYLPLIKNNRNVLLMPRLNSINSRLFDADFDELFLNNSCLNLDGIVVPKVNTPEEYKYIESRIIEKEKIFGLTNKFKLVIWIESTLAMVNIKDIFSLNKGRLIAACFGAEDYSNDLGIERTQSLKEIEYARSIFAMTAKAFNIVAIDTPNVDFKNPEMLIEEINYVKSLGFKGKFAIHPSQVDIINTHFSPSQTEVVWAKRVVEEYEKALEQGLGAISLDGKMVDVPVYKRALNVIKRS